MGTTSSIATNVAVNGTNALLYGDATFAATNMPLTTSYTAIAMDGYGRKNTNTATVSLSTSVSFQYDLNGNLTNDGTMSFSYDDENQLTQVWVPGQWLSQFTYDGKMRRRVRQESTWSGSSWTQTNAVYYVYDGNVVIQERDIHDNPLVTYTRGKDLSGPVRHSFSDGGSLQGAGGIGGLLARTDDSAATTLIHESGTSYYHADGNGNVTMLINGSQAVVAKYLYDAFGNTLSLSGPLANVNLYRFSSKEVHQNSGLVYYLYRYYDPNLQRWPNSDPIADLGFEIRRAHRKILIRALPIADAPNQYKFLDNTPPRFFDALGLGLGDPMPSNPDPVCQMIEKAIENAAFLAAFYSGLQEYNLWAEEMQNLMGLGSLYDMVGCNDPPPPPAPPEPDQPTCRNTRGGPPIFPFVPLPGVPGLPSYPVVFPVQDPISIGDPMLPSFPELPELPIFGL
jgi:RHS repeat-associated protein